MTKKITAAIYARFSSHLQKATSIDDQIRRTRELANTHGAQVPDDLIFSDAALSGTIDDSQRPGLASLLVAMQGKRFDILFVDELSRLYRDLVNQQLFLSSARACGIRVVDAAGFDSANTSAKLLSAIRGAMDEHYIEELKHRQRRGIDGQILRGYFHGRVPYGYKRQEVMSDSGGRLGTTWCIDSETAPIVKRIFELRKQGLAYASIAEQLTSDNIPSPSGGLWSSSSIQQVLKKPIYEGRYLLRPGSPNEIEHDHPDLAIVDHEIFVACQAQSKSISTTGRSGAKLWASGLVRCGCGHAATAHKYPNPTKEGRVFCFHCFQRSRIKRNPEGSNGASLSVLRDIISALLTKTITGHLFREFREQLEARMSAGPIADIQKLKNHIEHANNSLKRLVKVASTLADEDVSEIAAEIKKCTEARRTARAELEKLEALNPASDRADLAAQLTADMPGLVESLFDAKTVPPQALRAALRQIFPEITLEGRENHRISFWSVRFSPGVALAFAAKSPPALTESRLLSLRVISPAGVRSRTRVEVLPCGCGYDFPQEDEKRCSDCLSIKPLSEFSDSRSARDGKSPYCRSCARRRWAIYGANRKRSSHSSGDS